MILFKHAESLQNYLDQQRQSGKLIGFVPTMGALHEGHISLISLAKSVTDLTLASIFINPTQFNDAKDFEKYPTSIDKDIIMLEAAKCDVLFLPAVDEIYPDGIESVNQYPLGELEHKLEGAFRPGHFQGVCQVVDRLLSLVHPHKLLLGQKDFQQQLVIKKLVEFLHLSVEILTAPTLREPSGLAMSSRNFRLTENEKDQAKAIYNLLIYIRQNFPTTNFSSLEKNGKDYLTEHGFEKIDYLKIVNADTLDEVKRWDGTHHLLVVVAAFIGGVRLIDNMILTAT